MKISNVRSGGVCRIKCEGVLSIQTVAETKAAIMAALPRKGAIELDLSDVSESDTAGVQLLLMLRAEMCARGRAFTTMPLPASLLKTMQSAGLAVDALAVTGS